MPLCVSPRMHSWCHSRGNGPGSYQANGFGPRSVLLPDVGLSLRAGSPEVTGQMQSRGERGWTQSGAPRPCPGQGAGAKAAPGAPSGRSRLRFLELWAQVRGHLLLACSAGAAATQLVPKGPSAWPPPPAVYYGTTLAPRSFPLRPVSPLAASLPSNQRSHPVPSVCACPLNWSSPPSPAVGLGWPLPQLTHPDRALLMERGAHPSPCPVPCASRAL